MGTPSALPHGSGVGVGAAHQWDVDRLDEEGLSYACTAAFASYRARHFGPDQRGDARSASRWSGDQGTFVLVGAHPFLGSLLAGDHPGWCVRDRQPARELEHRPPVAPRLPLRAGDRCRADHLDPLPGVLVPRVERAATGPRRAWSCDLHCSRAVSAGWCRTRIGAFLVRRPGRLIPGPDTSAIVGAVHRALGIPDGGHVARS